MIRSGMRSGNAHVVCPLGAPHRRIVVGTALKIHTWGSVIERLSLILRGRSVIIHRIVVVLILILDLEVGKSLGNILSRMIMNAN